MWLALFVVRGGVDPGTFASAMERAVLITSWFTGSPARSQRRGRFLNATSGQRAYRWKRRSNPSSVHLCAELCAHWGILFSLWSKNNHFFTNCWLQMNLRWGRFLPGERITFGPWLLWQTCGCLPQTTIYATSIPICVKGQLKPSSIIHVI